MVFSSGQVDQKSKTTIGLLNQLLSFSMSISVAGTLVTIPVTPLS